MGEALAAYDETGAFQFLNLFAPGGDLLRTGSAEDPQWVLSDAIGSVTGLIAGDGKLTRIAYDEFGQPQSERRFDPTYPQGYSYFGFTGEPHDLATGLTYLRNRQYAPALGRFTSPDPLRAVVSDPMSMNAYMYALSNPLSWIDPLGLSPVDEGLDYTPPSGPITPEDIQAAKGLASLGVSFIPIVGDVKDLQEAVTGQDWITGEGLAWWERGLSAVATFVPFVGGTLVRKVVKEAVQHVDEGIDVLGHVLRASDDVGDAARGIADASDEVADAARGLIDDVSPAPGKTTVYVAKDGPDVEYVGITDNFKRRQGEHMQTGRTIEKVKGLQDISRADARAVEQVLIEQHGISRYGNGGTLSNAINSIARTNPIYESAVERGLAILNGINLE